MNQFFVTGSQINVPDARVVITGQDVNHIMNVLRMHTGEEIAVSNGVDGKEYRCRISDFTDTEVLCELEFIREEGVELPSRVTLFQGLPKSDKMELIIQKAVELGAYRIVPVATSRAIMKLEPKKEKSKIERWNSISEAAAKQSKRAVIPEVTGVMTMKQAVAFAKEMDVKLIPYELAEGMQHTKELITGLHPDQDIAIFIGPEGGFSPDEIDLCKANNIEPITLGKRILRTETAGFTVLSWIMYQLEN